MPLGASSCAVAIIPDLVLDGDGDVAVERVVESAVAAAEAASAATAKCDRVKRCHIAIALGRGFMSNVISGERISRVIPPTSRDAGEKLGVMCSMI